MSTHVLVAGPVAWNTLVYLDRLPDPHPHTVAARRHHDTVGGTSAGKALNLRRLGVRVTLRTLLGDDEPAAAIREVLTAAGVELDPTAAGVGDTERHVNLMDADGRRLSVHLTRPSSPRGGTETDLDLATYDAVVVDLAEQSRALLERARRAGAPVWCDIHDYDGADPFHADFVEAADHLFLSDDRLADPVPFMEKQVRAGKRLVVCTRGASGAIAVTCEGEWLEVPAVPVGEVVDTNGAGDAFFAGFLFGHLRGRSVAECLRYATLAGAVCVQSAELASAELTPALLDRQSGSRPKG